VTIADLVIRVRNKLNRPADDDRFPVDEIHAAVEDTARQLRREVALFEPELIITTEEGVAPDDATGATYTLAAIPEGGLRIFSPPGFVRGLEIFPADFGEPDGYVVSGRVIRMVTPRVFTPGIYARYVGTTPTIDGDVDLDADVLPSFMHPALMLGASERLARTPGSRINADEIGAEFAKEWLEVKRQRKMLAPAIEPHGGGDVPWWRGIA